jgi:hypothetical protein
MRNHKGRRSINRDIIIGQQTPELICRMQVVVVVVSRNVVKAGPGGYGYCTSSRPSSGSCRARNKQWLCCENQRVNRCQ